MNHFPKTTLLGAAAIGLALTAGTTFAQERQPAGTRAPDTVRQTDRDSAATAAPLTMRASRISGTVTGMKVENPAGEDVGRVEDLVIDMRSGKVSYAAVSTGGFLGVGDRLHAVPFEALQLAQRDDDYLFLLNVDRERLKNAPGFDKDNWPNFADTTWAVEVDRFYQEDIEKRRTARPRTSAFRPERPETPPQRPETQPQPQPEP
ncbi:MAG: PRC-barrel domain-containing protein [Planctomycetaceae bacterium]